MVVMHKSIRVDFAPGERIETAIKDAMDMAAFTRRPVKFRFNDIPMTIDPLNGASLAYKFDISPRKEWVKDIRDRVDQYVSEYHDKAEKRARRDDSGKPSIAVTARCDGRPSKHATHTTQTTNTKP